MKRILDDFYYGNISPGDQCIEKGSDYAKVMNLIVQYEDSLIARLNDEGREILKKHEDAHSSLLSITPRELWKQGFRLGLRIGIETMDDEGGNLEPIADK